MKKALSFCFVLVAGCCSSGETFPAAEPEASGGRLARQAAETPPAAPSSPGIPLYGPVAPAIDARVAAVSGEQPQLVLLSVGSDDRVQKGFHFSVYRGSEFVGKVVVEKVLKDSCGCRTLFTKEGFSIQAGDQAATRLQ